MVQLRLSDAEYASRRQTILARLGERGITAVVLFGGNNVSYFSRFGFIPTERPMAYILTANRSALLVPRLEGEHAEEFALVDKVVTYPEYPGERHPMEFLKDLLADFGLTHAQIGVDCGRLRRALRLSRPVRQPAAAGCDRDEHPRRCRVHADDQLRGGTEPDPRERALGQPRARLLAGVLQGRRLGDGDLDARLRRGDAGDDPHARQGVPPGQFRAARRVGGLSRPGRQGFRAAARA